MKYKSRWVAYLSFLMSMASMVLFSPRGHGLLMLTEHQNDIYNYFWNSVTGLTALCYWFETTFTTKRNG